MMNVNFKPGFTVINYEYNNPSSGGQHTIKPGDPAHSYYDPKTGKVFIYVEDGPQGEGWYTDDLSEFFGKNFDVSGYIEQ